MTATPAAAFFDQIGITNVVWLDDLFDIKTAPSAVDIAERVAVALASGAPLNHPKLVDLTAEDSAQEWANRIKERLEDSEQIELLSQMAQPAQGGGAPTQSDYSPTEIETVVTSLCPTMKRVGLAQWPTVKQELIASAASGVFLVDRELSAGGVSSNVGDEIVHDLAGNCGSDVVIVVLTHSVGPDGTEQLRTSLASELGVSASRLAVVSKRSDGASLAEGVRAAVRVALTQRTCAVITERVVSVMKESLTATEGSIGTLPVDALDRAVFENSLEEGASEIDVLTRILISRQRTDVDSHIAGALDDVHSPIARIRKLRLLEPLPVLPPTDAGMLREWRRDEVFDAGARLNALRSPLVCGDVFKKDGTKRYYILLGQPCDLVVRSNGSRAAREAVLVKLSSFQPDVAQNHRYFEVPPLEGTDPWAVDFREWVSVDLECLEWTSFNSDGRVAFTPAPQPPVGLLPGWEKRFVSARNKFQNERVYRLSLGDIPNASATATATAVEFPYRRIARLRGPRAAGVYAAFAAFQARGAFDHDFAKGLYAPGASTQ